ncbi:MAG TPA: hypothetical protein VMX17_16495 [Candidatus Glassbacteria bacterium]|nr:hypothetical protein [Candidatus Glassbacteria bacterium]
MEFDLFELIREFFQNMHAGVLLGICTAIFIVINILRGKVAIGDKQLKIPWITDAFHKLPKEAKTYILLAMFGITGILTTIANADKLSVWIILDGFLSGLMIGVVTLGIRQGVKQGTSGVKKFTQAMKEKRANKDQ